MRPQIAVVTASYNRDGTLRRLYQSLCAQDARNFVWVIVDDSSTDDSIDTITSIRQESDFEIQLLKNDVNRGKCASLNRVFGQDEFDFYLVVDSDDVLESDAIARVTDEVLRYERDLSIGALFFRFSLPNGTLLGPYIQTGSYKATRTESDARYGKYDGVVGYYRRAVRDYTYPIFPGENYIGPTVIQMEMDQHYAIVFVQYSIGTAFYQSNGLTNSGRALRLRNPCGMMHYSGLIVARSEKFSDRFKYRCFYAAYRRLAGLGINESPQIDGLNVVHMMVGFLLCQFWRKKYRES